MENFEFGQTRSFNLGIAKDTSIDAALIYDELAFLSTKTTNKEGWLYKTYQEMRERLPLSNYQVREAYKKLQEKGYIEIKLKKANGAPTMHFRLLKNLTMESKKTSYSLDSKKTEQSITATPTLKHQYGGVVEKRVRPDYRGKPSAAKERIRSTLQGRGIRELNKLTGG